MKKLAFLVLPFLLLLIFPTIAHAQSLYYFTASNITFDPGTHVLSFDISNITNGSMWWRTSQVGMYDLTSYGGETIGSTGYSGDQYNDLSPTCNDTHCTVTLTTFNYGAPFKPNDVVYIWVDGDNYPGWNSQSFKLGCIEPSTNTSPQVNSLSGATFNEGGTYSENGSFTANNPSATAWTAMVDYGDGSGLQPLTLAGANFSLSNVYSQPGTHTVTACVVDDQDGVGKATATVTVNASPSVGAITASPNPVQINTATSASASFTDANTTDTHTASWNWGDGNTTTGTVTETNGSGSVSDSHTYTATGVYTVTLTVSDNDGASGTSTYQYVAVYDSSTAFAGGRSFDNPTSASPSTTGKVSFGISSKYNSSNVLTGSVKMNFKAANLDFASTSLSSLATSTGKAYLKGSGTLNGNSGYTFLASGIDGSVVGGNDLIRFQIKDSSNNVVYDSQSGAGDTADPTTTDATGNIRVH